MGCSFSSETRKATLSRAPRQWSTASSTYTSSFCWVSPWKLMAPAEPRTVHQPGSTYSGLDHFGGEGHAGQQRRKVAAGRWELVFLLLQNVLLNGNKHAIGRIARIDPV